MFVDHTEADTARAERVVIEKHGRPVVVLAIEEYQRPVAIEASRAPDGDAAAHTPRKHHG